MAPTTSTLAPHLKEGDLVWSTAWAAAPASSTAVELAAGADRRVVLDGLTERDRAALLDGHIGGLTTAVRARLVELGAIGRSLDPAGVLTARVVAVDLGAADLAERLSAALPETARLASDPSAGEAVDLDVVLRCGPGAGAPEPGRPRLIVDVGASRVVVVGPLVHPGASACETCLDRVMRRRWTPAPQPLRPAVADEHQLIAAIVARHLRLIADGRSPVVNATIAVDVDAMTARREPLLMSPRCPTCATEAPAARPRLPWEEGS